MFRTKQHLAMQSKSPTATTYEGLELAYQFFNDRCFSGQLPDCLITLQRKRRAYGYFWAKKFIERSGENHTDEIALNPSLFLEQSVEEILQTLLHEMCHLWQFHFGKTSRAGYHNRQWADKMLEVGLIPSSTGKPGGRQVGQRMGDYVDPEGQFPALCKELLDLGFELPYVERQSPKKSALALQKRQSKTKYTCPGCGVNAWAKQDVRLACGDCVVPLVSTSNMEPH